MVTPGATTASDGRVAVSKAVLVCFSEICFISNVGVGAEHMRYCETPVDRDRYLYIYNVLGKKMII